MKVIIVGSSDYHSTIAEIIKRLDINGEAVVVIDTMAAQTAAAIGIDKESVMVAFANVAFDGESLWRGKKIRNTFLRGIRLFCFGNPNQNRRRFNE